MEKLTDEEILEGLQSANQREQDRALSLLYTHQYRMIANFIEANNGTANDAADIFQDAIIVFYEKIRKGQLELNCSIQTYLYSVCRNLWLNQLRIQKKDRALKEEMESVDIPEENLKILKLNEREQVLLRLMEKMKADCRKVISYYYFDRLKMKEIAKKMNLANEQVAKNKKSGCMKKLKSLIMNSPAILKLLK